MARTRNQRLKADGPLLKLAQVAVAQGWRIVLTHNCHVQWISPCGQVIAAPSTPGCTRGIKNHIARLRQAGLSI